MTDAVRDGMLDRLPGLVRTAVGPDAGHHVMLDRPRELVALLRALRARWQGVEPATVEATDRLVENVLATGRDAVTPLGGAETGSSAEGVAKRLYGWFNLPVQRREDATWARRVDGE